MNNIKKLSQFSALTYTLKLTSPSGGKRDEVHSHVVPWRLISGATGWILIKHAKMVPNNSLALLFKPDIN